MKRSGRVWLLPFLVLLCVTVPHLGQGDYVRDTGRYAAVGHFMWEGRYPWVPYLNPETPYFNKPPLALMIHGAFLQTFGVHLAVARLPSILAALGVVGLTMLTVREIGSRTEALTSGLVLASTYEFFRRTREISLDFWQLFFLMAAVYLAVTALRRHHRIRLVLAGVPIGLALLCKPLVGLVVIPIFGIWIVMARRPRWLPWLLLGTLPVAVGIALPWHLHIHALFGRDFLAQYFGHEVVDRALGLERNQALYYYLAENLRTYWPWALGVLFALVHRFHGRKPRRRQQRDLVLYALIWLGPVLLALSLFPDKKPNYALPLYPMLAWIVAYGLCRLPRPRLRRWYDSGFRGLAPALAIMLLLVSVAPIQFQPPPDRNWQRLFAWLQEHRVDSSRIAFDGALSNDVCYFYLKTGQWLRSWQWWQAHPETAPEQGYILTRCGSDRAKQSPDAVVFSAGNLALISTAPR
jgi:4-amino-4-deoxy-L-arabinose transferase-like glycosyltransferase